MECFLNRRALSGDKAAHERAAQCNTKPSHPVRGGWSLSSRVMGMTLDDMLGSLPRSPEAVLARWPVDRPVVMLHSGRFDPRWGRWSIVAEPRGWFRFAGQRSSLDGEVGVQAGAFAHDPLVDLERIVSATGVRLPRGNDTPFAGGWVGSLGYDLGRIIEPVAKHQDRETHAWPMIEMAWCPAALIFDHAEQRWTVAGDEARIAEWLPSIKASPAHGTIPVIDDLTGTWTPDEHLEAVRRTIDYIRAGDIFQANITQQFAAPFHGSTRRLACAAFGISQPLYGAYLEFSNGRTLLSMSPELFLEVNAESRRVTTRPIKGTRPAAADPDELRDSAKDAAELHMIVDLMRNDLGRVCEYGSVQVPVPRAIESHPTVHHGVSEIVGRLRDQATIGDLLRATFPGGSITGAPKIRAMQIIDEIEPVPRGPYCGSIGFLSNTGDAILNIAIRTMMLTGERPAGRFDEMAGELMYGAGGGIVADSGPAEEYREALDKTAVLRQLAERCQTPVGAPSLEPGAMISAK